MTEFGRKEIKPPTNNSTGAIGKSLDAIDNASKGRASQNKESNASSKIPGNITYHEANHHEGASPPDFNRIRNAALFRLLPKLDYEAAAQLSRDEIIWQLRDVIGAILVEMKITLNRSEERVLEIALVDELLGLGPLEVLLADPEVNDILVNGPKQIYVERKGKLELTDIQLRDEDHVRNIADRICTSVGRHIDSASPLVDARLADGSRVNVIISPLSLKGTAISIRKFSVHPYTLDSLVENGTMSHQMAVFLKASGASKLNIIISGGTGSGKTTLLNVLSEVIEEGERIITIEDNAELNLRQPHVLTLEARPRNLEGGGQVTIRDLVVNALRMRPDRIIVGEVRGGEVMDMLQAMNTGHEGSMATVHANGPKQSLTRLENMASMSGFFYPTHVIRGQLAEAINLIIQISRMKDGKRRITSIQEIVGIEDEEIILQELFRFNFTSLEEDGRLKGDFEYTGIEPLCMEKFRMFGYGGEIEEILNVTGK